MSLGIEANIYIYTVHFRVASCLLPLLLHTGGSDSKLYDGSDLKTYLLMRW